MPDRCRPNSITATFIWAEFREISKFSFLSLNCYFWKKITTMMTWMNSRVLTNWLYLWFSRFSWKNWKIIYKVNSWKSGNSLLLAFLCVYFPKNDRLNKEEYENFRNSSFKFHPFLGTNKSFRTNSITATFNPFPIVTRLALIQALPFEDLKLRNYWVIQW